MFSAINVYTSACAHSINMFPPLAKNPVSIPAVFKSGWGKDPPEELQQAIARRRDVTKHTYY